MKTIASFILVVFTLSAVAQNDLKKYEVDFRSWVKEDIELTSAQQERIENLNRWTNQQVGEIAEAYEFNSKIYNNKVALIIEERDAKLEDILTLEQYAVYMNSIADNQQYDSKYKDDDVTIKKSKDGDMKMKSDKGKVKVTDEKVVVKNKKTNEKTVITKDEIDYENDETGREVEIEQDEVEVETEEKSEEVSEDGAELKTENKKVKIKQ